MIGLGLVLSMYLMMQGVGQCVFGCAVEKRDGTAMMGFFNILLGFISFIATLKLLGLVH